LGESSCAPVVAIVMGIAWQVCALANLNKFMANESALGMACVEISAESISSRETFSKSFEAVSLHAISPANTLEVIAMLSAR